MKKLLYVLAGIVVLVAIIVPLVFWLTSAAVTSAEDFLSMIGAGKVHEAYLSTSTVVQAQQNEAAFAQAVEHLGLTRYKSASWSSRSVQNNQATLSGTVETVDGGTIPLTVELVKEEDGWNVLSVTGPSAGAATEAATEAARPAPSDGELKQLPTDTLPQEAGQPAPVPPPDASGGTAFRLVANEQLKGRLGRLLVAFPEGSNPSGARIEVYPAGETQQSTSAYGRLGADLLPGSYDLVISGERVSGVTVESRHDTHALVGVLRVTAGSGTRVAILSGPGEGTEITSAYGNAEFGLPVGTYQVLVSGQKVPVTIVAGAVMEF